MARISNAMLNKWSSCLPHSNIRKNPHFDIRSQYRFLGEVTFKNVLFVMTSLYIIWTFYSMLKFFLNFEMIFMLREY